MGTTLFQKFALSQDPDLPLLSVKSAYEYTDANMATVREHMGRGHWHPYVLLALWLVSIVLAARAAGLLSRSFAKDFAAHSRRLCLGGSFFAVSIAVFFLYAYRTIPGNIRIDILLLLPVLGLGAVLLVLSAVVWVIRKLKRKLTRQKPAASAQSDSAPSETHAS